MTKRDAKQERKNRDVLDRANDLLSCIYRLDDACAILHGFRSLLEDLNSRSPIELSREQVDAVAIVRAGILRSAIGLAVAMLDKSDRRGNRASLGYIIEVLNEDEEAADCLSTPHATRVKPIWQKLRERYEKILAGPIFEGVQRLRNDEIGHLLVREKPTPTVEYADTFALIDEIEKLLITLYEGLPDRQPRFAGLKKETAERAKLFWHTYLAGAAALTSRPDA